MSEERVGRLLRANGRYSITHRFLTESQDDGIATACGLLYGPDELYESDEIPPFEFGHLPGGIGDCSGCFEGGTSSVYTATTTATPQQPAAPSGTEPHE
jgi:hypothetical protein